jgi:hypothetical protein
VKTIALISLLSFITSCTTQEVMSNSFEFVVHMLTTDSTKTDKKLTEKTSQKNSTATQNFVNKMNRKNNLQKITMNDSQTTELGKRIASFLNNQFEETKKIPKENFLPVVKQQITKSLTYGFEMESQVATYVTTAWLLGLDFDTEFPAASDVLNSSEYTAEEKANFLESWTIEMFKVLEGK